MQPTAATGYRTISNHEFVSRRQNISTGHNAIFALRPFKAGEVITAFSAGSVSAFPTYLTIQTGIRRHITLVPEFLQYTNHSCEPNVFFDTTRMELIAIKEILPEDELRFFYPSTEWKMTQPFHCFCESPHCLGEIKGAAFLSEAEQMRYRLSDFIKNQLAKKAARTKVA